MQLSVLVQTICIGLAGGCGACARYALGNAIALRTGVAFPLGTLIINLSGAFVICFLFSLSSHRLLPAIWQTILATGFLGGYTTFSTLCWEGFGLVRGGGRFSGQLYLVGSLLGGLLAGLLGLYVGGIVA
jgi:CrcB protein